MKSFLFISTIVLVLIIGGIFYFYNQVTFIPDKYENMKPKEMSNIIQSSDKIFSEIKSRLNSGKHVEINNEELQAIIIANAKRKLNINLEEVIKEINTNINENRVQIEAVVNVKNIPIEQIPKKVRSFYKNFLESVPGDVFENFYVKFEGKPVEQNGNITLDKNAYIQLGKITYSLRDLSEQISGRTNNKNTFNINILPHSNIVLQEGLIEIAPE